MKKIIIKIILLISIFIFTITFFVIRVSSKTTILEKNVFVIAYGNFNDLNTIEDWYYDSYIKIGYSKEDIEFRTFKLIDYIRCGSTWHGNKYFNCNENFKLNYKIYNFVYYNEIPPYGKDGNFDYIAIYKRFNLCNLIKTNKIDEIWVWEPGNGYASEWITSRFINSTGNPLSNNMPPFYGKTISILNFNYISDITMALHTFGHRIEGAMLVYHYNNFHFGSDSNSFTARPSPDNNYVGNCGDIHRPPNVYTTHDLEYIYDAPEIAISTCNTWSPGNIGTKKVIGCENWGCNPGGYYIWWMQHIPENWWKDLFK